MATQTAASVTLLHKASGTTIEVGKTAYDAGEFDPDEYICITPEKPKPKSKS